MDGPAASLSVALLGFGSFERSALVSYLRLTGLRSPAYRETDTIAGADFLVADTDHAGTLDAVLGADRVADTVFIGSLAPEGALAWMMRPIDPLQVFRELDAAVALRRRSPPEAAAAAPTRRPAPAFSAAAPAVLARPDAAATTAADGAVAAPPSRRADDDVAPLSALLVDGDPARLRVLEGQLQGLGLRTASARSSQQAEALLAGASFDLVLLELELDAGSALDGLALCQLLRRARAPDAAGPLLLVTSQQGSPTDRVRAAFAGCDAHLAKPIDDATLRRTLRRLGLRLGGPQDSGFDSRPGRWLSRPMPIGR